MISEKNYIPLRLLKIENTIYFGKFSKIIKVTCKTNGVPLVIKEFKNDFGTNADEVMKEKITRECQIITSLRNKAIAYSRFFTGFRIKEETYIGLVMSYYPNGTLEDFLERRRLFLLPEQIQSNNSIIFVIIGGIIHGMRYLRSVNIIHRNLTPKNILLDEKLYPIITDFGLAIYTNKNYSDEVYLDDPKEYVDPVYIAPEIWTRNRYSPASDVYSFGMILYEIVTGKKPFFGLNKNQIIAKVTNLGSIERPEIPENVPEILKKVIQKCWSQEPDERPTFLELFRNFYDLSSALGVETSYIQLLHTVCSYQTDEPNKHLVVPISDPDLSKFIIYPDDENDGKSFSFSIEPINEIDFEIVKKIGKGSFGSVFQVKKKIKSDESIYAAKISNDIINIQTKNKRSMNFFREVMVLSKMHHPSIIKFIGYTKNDFSNNPRPMIITNFIPNGSLEKVIDLERRGLSIDGWNNTKKLLNIYGIASAMKFIHSLNILHRDLKPDNIPIDEYLNPVIADLGLAMDLSLFDYKYENNIAGTLVYMSPEAIQNYEYTKKGDVYSYGIIVYQIITAELLYPDVEKCNFHKIANFVVNGDRPKFRFPIPECYKSLIESCWDQNPKKRPSFDGIVDFLKNDPRFREEIDEDQFDDYIEFIDKYINESNSDDFQFNIDEFIRNHKKTFQRIDIKKTAPKKVNFDQFYGVEGFLNLNNFEKKEKIGVGEFSKVFKIKMKGSNKEYAAKISKIGMDLVSKDNTDNISKEVSILSKLQHPSIQKTYGYSILDFKNDQKPVIITELSSSGETLEDILNLERNGEIINGWNNTKILIVIFGIASSMLYLHSYNILHRNLRPTNIFIDKNFHPKISDFGYYIQNYVDKTMTHHATIGVKRNPEYTAPEILNGQDFIKPSDVYSFAMIVYELITKTKVFSEYKNYLKFLQNVVVGEKRPKIDKSVPLCYKELIEKCWCQNPDERLTFDDIVCFLKFDERFFYCNINRKEYLDYINYIEANTKEANLNDDENNDESKDKTEKDDESKDKAEKNDESKDKAEKNDESKDKAEKDDESKDKAEKDDELKNKIEEYDESEYIAEKDDESKDKIKKDDESDDKAEKDYESKDKVEKDDELKNKIEKDDELRNKIEKDDESEDKAEKDDESKDKIKKDDELEDKAEKDDKSKNKTKKDDELEDKAEKDDESKNKIKKDYESKDKAEKDDESKNKIDKNDGTEDKDKPKSKLKLDIYNSEEIDASNNKIIRKSKNISHLKHDDSNESDSDRIYISNSKHKQRSINESHSNHGNPNDSDSVKIKSLNNEFRPRSSNIQYSKNFESKEKFNQRINKNAPNKQADSNYEKVDSSKNKNISKSKNVSLSKYKDYDESDSGKVVQSNDKIKHISRNIYHSKNEESGLEKNYVSKEKHVQRINKKSNSKKDNSDSEEIESSRNENQRKLKNVSHSKYKDYDESDSGKVIQSNNKIKYISRNTHHSKNEESNLEKNYISKEKHTGVINKKSHFKQDDSDSKEINLLRNKNIRESKKFSLSKYKDYDESDSGKAIQSNNKIKYISRNTHNSKNEESNLEKNYKSKEKHVQRISKKSNSEEDDFDSEEIESSKNENQRKLKNVSHSKYKDYDESDSGKAIQSNNKIKHMSRNIYHSKNEESNLEKNYISKEKHTGVINKKSHFKQDDSDSKEIDLSRNKNIRKSKNVSLSKYKDYDESDSGKAIQSNNKIKHISRNTHHSKNEESNLEKNYMSKEKHVQRINKKSNSKEDDFDSEEIESSKNENQRKSKNETQLKHKYYDESDSDKTDVPKFKHKSNISRSKHNDSDSENMNLTKKKNLTKPRNKIQIKYDDYDSDSDEFEVSKNKNLTKPRNKNQIKYDDSDEYEVSKNKNLRKSKNKSRPKHDDSNEDDSDIIYFDKKISKKKGDSESLKNKNLRKPNIASIRISQDDSDESDSLKNIKRSSKQKKVIRTSHH